MITFEFDYETHNSDGSFKDRLIYWLISINVTGGDRAHEDEIYEQLEAEQVFNV
jgi:hypothetical protein